ncbi:MAG: glycosyltransferase family 39 protein [Candidatus Micrarchaeota archaeon]|nr:glycosyltransferase family 39 protein [Candidatus Micrarchaeota archaeon]
MQLLGYIFTSVLAISLIALIASIVMRRKQIAKELSARVDRKSLFALLALLSFFTAFSLLLVSPVEQLYFDENIYQGIAMNILSHGNALWCQYGTGFVHTCFANSIYHDIIGYPFLLAIAFGIFGIGTGTAYALQLLVGALSILFIFLLASMFFERKGAAVAATAIFALIPQLFIWSRTQAIPDLALMSFATLTFFLFLLFIRRIRLDSLITFMSALTLTVYMRIEAILLLPIFFVLFLTYGEEGIRHTIRHRLTLAIDNLNNNTKLLLALLGFFMLLMPEIYYLSMQLSNPSYGQDYTNQQVFSIANFQNNFPINIQFLLGNYNSITQFPLVFPVETTALAALGIILLIASKRRNRFGMLLLPVLWFLAFNLFYGFFYAGAATFGVDDRFMLEMIPALALLGGFAISELSAAVGELAKRKYLHHIVYGAIIIGVVIYPFVTLIPNITLKPTSMPQQTVIYDALSFFYSNYNSVPANCMVFTFTPDLWEEFNRSAAQIDYVSSTNSQFLNDTKNYACRVIDYGYWCNVPPNKGTVCKNLLQNYDLLPLASQNNSARGENFAFYQILGKR